MKPIALITVTLALSGCAALIGGNSETVCPGNEGVACASTRDAYKMSNHRNNFSKGAQDAMADAPVASLTVSLPQPVSQPMPVMQPAQVMRVWVNRWVDANGDLNYPSLVYTEVTPRRWAVGPTQTNSTGKVVTAFRIEGNDNGAAMVTSAGRPAARGTAPAAPPDGSAALPQASAPQQPPVPPAPLALPSATPVQR